MRLRFKKGFGSLDKVGLLSAQYWFPVLALIHQATNNRNDFFTLY
jgi:hypothetical protein